jgi:MFS family permease
VLIVANAVTGAGVLSLLLVQGPQQLWLMYAVAVSYGTSFVVIGPVSAGLVKDLLPDKDLAGANAGHRQGLRVAFPLAGAGLYAGFGRGSLAILDAAMFAIAVAVLVTIRLDESPVPPAGHAPVRQALLAGLGYLRATSPRSPRSLPPR